MSILTIISELWRFFKEHFKRLLMWGLIGSLIVLGVQYGLNYFKSPEDLDAYNYLSEVYSQEPAEFEAIVTLDDGNVLQNSYLFDEYFTTPEVMQEVKDRTGVDVTRWYESEKLLGFEKSSLFRGGIAGIRNTSSGVITFRFLVAPTAEENLKVAQAYRDILTEGSIPFMENQTASIMVEPVIEELLDLELTPEVPTPETLKIFSGNGLLTNIIFAIAGFILGMILGLMYYFVRRLLDDDIQYAFDYTWNYDDLHQMLDQGQLNADTTEHFIQMPGINSIVIGQDRIEAEEPAKVFSHLAETDSSIDPLSEIVLLVESGKTSKEWFREQYQAAKRYQLPIRIVHQY
ncbi:hypothetical protein HZY86_00965 [Aerococcaceae bacterium DSM 111020]|nr:hypothetical protein [Aerococcaceae bacterium DSM 111020]